MDVASVMAPCGGHAGRDRVAALSSPDIMGGTPVFAGTRVPVQTFVEYLEAGDPLDEFLIDFPSVTRWNRNSADG